LHGYVYGEENAERRIVGIDLSGLVLHCPVDSRDAFALHDALADFNYLTLVAGKKTLAVNSLGLKGAERTISFAGITAKLPVSMQDVPALAALEQAYAWGRDDIRHGRLNAEIPSTLVLRLLGYDGVDVRHLERLDNTGYGSVVFPERPRADAS
jgi:hypothetical protein